MSRLQFPTRLLGLLLLFAAASTTSALAQESATLDSGGSGGFVEVQGYDDVYQGLPNSISYGIKFTIAHNKIKGTASSSELQVGGNVVNRSLTLKGKVTGCTASKLIQWGDYLYYKKAKGVFNFSLSDGTRFSGVIKGTIDSGGGYRMTITGKFMRSDLHDTDYTFVGGMNVTSGSYSW